MEDLKEQLSRLTVQLDKTEQVIRRLEEFLRQMDLLRRNTAKDAR